MWTSKDGGEDVSVRYDAESRQDYRVRLDEDEWSVRVVSLEGDELTLVISSPDGESSIRQSYVVIEDGDTIYVQDDQSVEGFTEPNAFPSVRGVRWTRAVSHRCQVVLLP